FALHRAVVSRARGGFQRCPRPQQNKHFEISPTLIAAKGYDQACVTKRYGASLPVTTRTAAPRVPEAYLLSPNALGNFLPPSTMGRSHYSSVARRVACRALLVPSQNSRCNRHRWKIDRRPDTRRPIAKATDF